MVFLLYRRSILGYIETLAPAINGNINSITNNNIVDFI